MGLFDTVHVSNGVDEKGNYIFIDAQVKCWNRDFRTYEVGSIVPEIEVGVHTYFVALREGGFLFIENDRIMRWLSESEMQRPPIFDKWGMPFDFETETTEKGLLPHEPYRFKR